MRTRNLLLSFIVVSLFTQILQAEKYAILISGGKTTYDNTIYHSEYWYDLFLAYEDLVLNEGFSQDKIYVCYGDGQSFSSSNDRYKLSLHGWSNIVDYDNQKFTIQSVFQSVANLMTTSDYIIIRWVCGHGINNYNGSASSDRYAAYIENRNYYITEQELIDYIDQICNFNKRIILWQTCHSGCLKEGSDKLYNDNSYAQVCCKWDEVSYSISSDGPHCEYNYWATGYLSGKTPAYSSLNADDNGDTHISMTELFTNTNNQVSFSTVEQEGLDNSRICTKINGLIPITTSGSLSHNETWWAPQQPILTNNVTIPSGIDLLITSGTHLDLNGFTITTTGGTIAVESGVTINSSNSHTRLITGSAIKGIYSTIASAMSAATGGQSIEVYGSHTLAANLTVPSGVTLTFKNGSDITLDSHTIQKGTGTLAIESGATFTPDIRLMSGSTVLGLYTTIADAFNHGSELHLRGEFIFNDTYTLTSGRKLVAQDGALLKYPSGKTLEIAGGATLEGNNATFTSISGTWGGIYYQENSSGSYHNPCNSSHS